MICTVVNKASKKDADWLGRELYFGRYPQGARDAAPKAIAWTVLDVHDGVAVLLSKYGLYTTGYYTGNVADLQENRRKLIWEYSTIRQWMNEDFLRAAFSEAEQEKLVARVIVTSEESTPEQQSNRVFLLSEESVRKFLPCNEDRQTQPTPYAAYQGARIDMYPTGNCCWWLLPEETELFDERFPKAVFENGDIQFHGRNVGHWDFVVRPAIQISVEELKTLTPKKERHPLMKELENKWYISRLLSANKAYRKKQYAAHSFKTRIQQEPVKTPQPKPQITKSERYSLDDQKMYFVTAFYAQDTLVKWSVDKEAGNDSHYELSKGAAQELCAVLQTQYDGQCLQDLLRHFFRENSDYHLVSLLTRNDIPFQQFHFDDYND